MSSVAVIGIGNIGGTLARTWAGAGHEVILGVRDPNGERVRALVAQLGGRGRAATPRGAVAASDVVLLAVPGASVSELVDQIGDALGTRVVIDATNAIRQPTANAFAVIRAAAPGAQLARAFNSLGWENLANPRYGTDRATMFYCADDGPARAVTEGLIADAGLDPVCVGGADQVDVVDGVLRLWIALAFGGTGREIAFKLLRR